MVKWLSVVYILLTAGWATSQNNAINVQMNKRFEKEWAEVDSLEKEGLYRQAVEKVDLIFEKACRIQDHAQIIKSTLYNLKFNANLEEEDVVKGIIRLEKSIETAPTPSKEILHSLTGQVLWSYYNGHRWQFEDRTYVEGAENLDIRTWDLKRIVERIIFHYSASIANSTTLTSHKLIDFEEILMDDFSPEALQIRPTMYHFLTYRAIDFYRSATFDIPGAAETKPLNQPELFGTSEAFLQLNFTVNSDAHNPTFLGLKVFQALTQLHQSEKNSHAKFEVELERILFVRSRAVLDNKEALYYDALVRLETENKARDFSTGATYYRALYHSKLAENYSSDGDTTHRWEYTEALALCDDAIKNHPNSLGARQCENLRSQILQKALALKAVAAIAPKSPSTIFVEYRNVDKLFVKVVPFDHKVRVSDEVLVGMLEEAKGVQEKAVNLILPEDYQKHSTEIPLDPLKSQFYYVVVCTDAQFKMDGAGFAYTPLWVSNTTYQTRRTEDEQQILVTDRTTGTPIKGAEVNVWQTKYDYLSQSYKDKLHGKYKTDAKGLAAFKPENGGNSYTISVLANGELYAPSSSVYAYRYRENTRKQEVTTFFTDRKIYRPGQTIYFKGILIEYEGEQRTLVKNAKRTVQFLDHNYQEIAKMEVVSNEFGSFQGTFEAPVGTLTGSMLISTATGSTYFNVEEYKRPKFYAEMQPVQGEYQFSDTIRAKGTAKAYAGNAIDGAEVTYRVTRSVSYPRYFYWCSWYGNYSEDEIVTGKTKTKDDGTFEIEFPALPDVSIARERSPQFNFTIHVDVTDINGETHSTSSSVSVGYTSLQLGSNLQDELVANGDFTLRIQTTNLSGEKVNAQGKLSIEKLVSGKEVLYDRFWQRPDLPIISDELFKKQFPNVQLANEKDWHSWKSEKQVFSQLFNTAESDSVRLDGLQNWAPGVYRYQATTKDKNGVEVKDEHYFVVYDPAAKVIPVNEVLWVKPLKTTAEPGENVEFLIGTAEENVSVMYDFVVKNKIVESRIIKLSKEQKTICFEVSENHRGNVFLAFSAVKNNHQFSESHVIYVPHSNKELDIEWMSFRDKLLPGQQEEWTIKINNRKGEKENAEMLATLYDASLDALSTPNDFYMNIYNTYYGISTWGGAEGANAIYGNSYDRNWNQYVEFPQLIYPQLNYHQYYLYDYYGYRTYYFDVSTASYANAPSPTLGDVRLESMDMVKSENESLVPLADGIVSKVSAGNVARKEQSGEKPLAQVQPRTNFNETAFFFPQLHTDADGTIRIKFTIPESLTEWRFAALAHTKDLKIGGLSDEIITQKELMVVPNVPRFLREGDAIELSTKISNVSDKNLVGSVRLELIDPTTDQVIDGLFSLTQNTKSFEATAGKSTVVNWSINVPNGITLVKYRIIATAGNFSDGEENVLPILSNRMLVTESLPMPIRWKGTTNFSFDKLKNAGKSQSLTHHRFSIEFTSNPAWYAIQAMPYMMEFPHECAEQVFTRYYSNTIASHIMNSNPKIRDVIEKWGAESSEAFLSNLQKNEELKAVLLEETPWVLDAQSEEQSKKNLAILLDMQRMAKEQKKALAKTIKSQSSNGGWPWFPGMKENRYISQHILTGMGHLNRLGMLEISEDRELAEMIERGIAYLDQELVRDFNEVKRIDPNYKKNKHIGYNEIQYLYARSFFMNLELNPQTIEAVNFYKEQANTYWKDFSIAGEGMLALAANRLEMGELATKIVKSLKDRSITHKEFGMYWKDYQNGYYWYQAPIETQALMIELFDEVAKDQSSVEELKIWLLKQKQTTNWKTTKQTTEAVYALLLRGTDLLASDELVQVKVGGQPLVYEGTEVGNPYRVKAEPGTGYFKTSWTGTEVKPAMGDVQVTKTTDGVAWGAAYWQYFEQMDKITFAETGLQISKKLYKVTITPEGEKLELVSANNQLSVGDKVRVRIELRSDRNLEYVHMKDMRAAGFEPLDVLSRYRYQDGLGYYQSTKDVSTNFFFDYIQKGTYVFEYDLRVQHKGDFSNGITTIQCMYAPEFTSHSEGIRVEVE